METWKYPLTPPLLCCDIELLNLDDFCPWHEPRRRVSDISEPWPGSHRPPRPVPARSAGCSTLLFGWCLCAARPRKNDYWLPASARADPLFLSARSSMHAHSAPRGPGLRDTLDSSVSPEPAPGHSLHVESLALQLRQPNKDLFSYAEGLAEGRCVQPIRPKIFGQRNWATALDADQLWSTLLQLYDLHCIVSPQGRNADL